MKTVSNKIENNNLLVKIEGEVDVYTSIDLKKELEEAAKNDNRSVSNYILTLIEKNLKEIKKSNSKE